MALVLYGHPFSSYTQKVLIPLYENNIPFEFREIGPETQQEHMADWLARSPMSKFPVLVDGDRGFVEASVINEYLHLAYPGPVKLLPSDPIAALEARFLDRYFDLYLMDALQISIETAIGRFPLPREQGLAIAKERAERAYVWLDKKLAGRTWAAGEDFTLADCAASPALFYADWVHQISEEYPTLRAYRSRLLARPAFARCVDEARYFRPNYPLGAPNRD